MPCVFLFLTLLFSFLVIADNKHYYTHIFLGFIFMCGLAYCLVYFSFTFYSF